ncbi:unnamed protein product, partial [Allacma fusca]
PLGLTEITLEKHNKPRPK